MGEPENWLVHQMKLAVEEVAQWPELKAREVRIEVAHRIGSGSWHRAPTLEKSDG